MPLFPRRDGSASEGSSAKRENRPTRVLFLDDDETRATIFLAMCPHAVWVQTAADCIAELEQTWDEIHLDHDLGGEQFVDTDRDDCGMEVVRWICLTHRPHLRATKFFIHSHNPLAATVMGVRMSVSGFMCEVRPFGVAAEAKTEANPSSEADYAPELTRLQKARAWVRRRLGLPDDIDPAFYDYLAQRPGPDDAPPERPDFNWSLPKTSREAEEDHEKTDPTAFIENDG